MPSVPEIMQHLPDVHGPLQLVFAAKIVLLLALLSFGPAVLISMTSFARIVIVLSFLRKALGVQNIPPLSIITALSLFLTCVVMAPVARKIDARAVTPYTQHQLSERQAFAAASGVLREFLDPQTRDKDLHLLHELSREAPSKTRQAEPLHLLVPAFMLSELRTAFELGFLIFLPFLAIDLIAAWLLKLLGMVMVPSTMLATPLKLLLFIVVDGWGLLARSLVNSFH